MIEQYLITRTPKYNFPPNVKALQTPQKFVELSLKTIKTIRQQTERQSATIFNNYPTVTLDEMRREPPFLPSYNQCRVQSIQLKPINKETTIIALDVSSMKIGETNRGIICAIRGTAVWKERTRYRYLRIGPFLLHMTEENKAEINQLLRQHSLSIPKELLCHPSLINMPTKLGNLFEQWMKMEISRASHDSIILWDGSLTAGTPSNSMKAVSQTLEMARAHCNTVLAFSKNTYLRFLNHQLAVTGNPQSPYLLEINGFPTKIGSFSLLGKIYLTRLTSDWCSFRLDIDKKVPDELRIEAVEKLLGNDLLPQSYPETLRLAHIFSTFTATEVIGMQRFLVRTCRLKLLPNINLRRLLFGSFGKGPEA